jgi:Fe-S cluster assembly scaffold protein SufB
VYVQPTLDDEGNPKEETLTLETTIPFGASSDIIIVIAKEGAQLKMESILKGGEASSVFVRTMIILMEGGTKATIISRTKDAKGLAMMEHAALVSAHASCGWVEDPQSAMRYRSHTISLLLGEEATSEILHTLIGTENASYDIWAGAEHCASDTHSRIYALGLGGANSKIVYRGMIDMKKGVHAVDGAQEGKFLIISPKAEIDAIPELDIASRDVASTHKLSVSHIRDIDLFYAKTRGIPEHEAREIAVEGFFGSLLSRIKKEEIMESVRERIAKLTNTKT